MYEMSWHECDISLEELVMRWQDLVMSCEDYESIEQC